MCFLVALVLFNIKAPASSQFLTGVNDTYLSFDELYRPIVFGGDYYVPSTVFNTTLSVKTIDNDTTLILYDFYHIVTIDKISATVHDQDLEIYNNASLMRGNVFYVNATILCEIFEFDLSYINQNNVEILRISNHNATMSDIVFAAYVDIKLNQEVEPTPPDVQIPTEPTTPPIVTPEIPVYITEIYPYFISSTDFSLPEVFFGNSTLFLDLDSFEIPENIRKAYINDLELGIYIPSSIETFDDTIEYINEINTLLFNTLGIKSTILLFESNPSYQNDISNLGYHIKSIDFSSFSQNMITYSTKKIVSIDLTQTRNINTFLSFVAENNITLSKESIFR